MWKEKSVHIIFHLLKHSFQNTCLKQTIKTTKFSHLEKNPHKHNQLFSYFSFRALGL